MKKPVMNAFFALLVAASSPACAITSFQHIIVIVQENRTPDNLFYALCNPASRCSTSDNTKYDIQTSAWLNKQSTTGTTNPTSVVLANAYDLTHSHTDFLDMCDFNTGHTLCQMDAAYKIGCIGACTCETPTQNLCPFAYVDNSSGTLDPYLALVTQYGWANYMFQTNQGPSFPAHQFLFGATSAPSQSDDQAGTFAAENYLVAGSTKGGCIAPSGTTVLLIDARGNENPTPPCFEHETLSDLFDSTSLTWKYYAVGGTETPFEYLWNAPLAIDHICVPASANCTGALYVNNVDLTPADILSDIQNPACTLQSLSWVTPTAENSDHAENNTGGGPEWVANIVDAAGASTSTCGYWQNTAIIVTWDDWGGWYDHETPTILTYPYSAYAYGFRVPMIFISAYTPQGYIDNNRSDFGAIARFIEYNFGFTPGVLGFADSRGDTTQRLQGFYNFQNTPHSFVPIPVRRDAASFIHDKSPPLPPDID